MHERVISIWARSLKTFRIPVSSVVAEWLTFAIVILSRMPDNSEPMSQAMPSFLFGIMDETIHSTEAGVVLFLKSNMPLFGFHYHLDDTIEASIFSSDQSSLPLTSVSSSRTSST